MTTETIDCMEDVRVGDDVTLTRDGLTVSGRVRPEGTAVGSAQQWHIWFPGVGTLYGMDGWRLISATREVPEWEPGMAGTATVRGVEGVRVMRLSANKWVSPRVPTYSGTRSWFHTDQNVTDFVPDDIEALRADLDAERAKVSDLTGRNAALEALVQEQKQGIQARNNWIEEQTADL